MKKWFNYVDKEEIKKMEKEGFIRYNHTNGEIEINESLIETTNAHLSSKGDDIIAEEDDDIDKQHLIKSRSTTNFNQNIKSFSVSDEPIYSAVKKRMYKDCCISPEEYINRWKRYLYPKNDPNIVEKNITENSQPETHPIKSENNATDSVEDNRLYSLGIYEYCWHTTLTRGQHFGEIPVDDSESLSIYTVISQTDCDWGSLTKKAFNWYIRAATERFRRLYLIFISNSFLFSEFSMVTLQKKYFNYFLVTKPNKGGYIFRENEINHSLYLLKEGEYEITMMCSLKEWGNHINNIFEKSKNFYAPCDKEVQEIWTRIHQMHDENRRISYSCNDINKWTKFYNEKINWKISTIKAPDCFGCKKMLDENSKHYYTIKWISEHGEYLTVDKEVFAAMKSYDISVSKKEEEFYCIKNMKLVKRWLDIRTIKIKTYFDHNRINEVSDLEADKVNRNAREGAIKRNERKMFNNLNRINTVVKQPLRIIAKKADFIRMFSQLTKGKDDNNNTNTHNRLSKVDDITKSKERNNDLGFKNHGPQSMSPKSEINKITPSSPQDNKNNINTKINNYFFNSPNNCRRINYNPSIIERYNSQACSNKFTRKQIKSWYTSSVKDDYINDKHSNGSLWKGKNASTISKKKEVADTPNANTNNQFQQTSLMEPSIHKNSFWDNSLLHLGNVNMAVSPNWKFKSGSDGNWFGLKINTKQRTLDCISFGERINIKRQNYVNRRNNYLKKSTWGFFLRYKQNINLKKGMALGKQAWKEM